MTHYKVSPWQDVTGAIIPPDHGFAYLLPAWSSPRFCVAHIGEPTMYTKAHQGLPKWDPVHTDMAAASAYRLSIKHTCQPMQGCIALEMYEAASNAAKYDVIGVEQWKARADDG